MPASLTIKGLPVVVQDPEGVDLGGGRFKQGDATVVPSRALLQEKRKKKEKPVEKKPVPSVKPVVKTNEIYTEQVQLVFETPVGDLSGSYWPVIQVPGFLILGLTSNSFVPKAYKESPDLVLKTTINNQQIDVVYSGCRFRDSDYDREYIIFIEVTK